MYCDIWNNSKNKQLTKQLGFEPADLNAVVLSPKTVPEFKKIIAKHRQEDFVILHKPNEKVLRAAIQDCSIDATDAFVEYPLIKKLAERNIAVLLSFKEVLYANTQKLPKLLYLMTRTVKLAKKNNIPVMITSAADSDFEQRSVSELIAFGECLGMSVEEAKKALFVHQTRILKRKQLKKAGKWIMPGVEVV